MFQAQVSEVQPPTTPLCKPRTYVLRNKPHNTHRKVTCLLRSTEWNTFDGKI